ncbi:hypothetical protein BX616_009493 [Lobosporangium transversale]|uniref:Uncharacterized protein n=1 Tax=Lobosporangium transversale TaxID=64571 RepID=A0A1Y2GQL0_9FUNG|nr:hypothetical protein BCR41DRAFT_86828 [Lobosporangium transversale]KAF9918301.1 hypothetical protein BX616_009493 [Lobosporangium transversale]ORZ14405.1 hypothetical protein BCR41DRAFT_86828 [Lobosporangium transversale]|eukprot:XP_021880883.1 hypothetical protein BCR41DRAFT_86828 [Lobosporangium transversale]
MLLFHSTMNHSEVRVFAKHLQAPGVVHQVCIGDWTGFRNEWNECLSQERPDQLDVIVGKGSFLSLYKFTIDKTDVEERPKGSFQIVHEQPVFGTIKDMKVMRCTFETEVEGDMKMETDMDDGLDRPRYGYLPRHASSFVVAVTSDSGYLSLLTFYFNGDTKDTTDQGKFYTLQQVYLYLKGVNMANWF